MNSQIIVATVAENTDPFLTEVKWLFSSLRKFGGRISNAKCVVYFVNSLPDDLSVLQSLDVEAKVVDTIEPRYPHCNKIHMLLDETLDCEWLIALDTDVIIMDDFRDYLTGDAIAAKIVDENPLNYCLWEFLFNHFGLPIPNARYLTHFHCRESLPYFNSGVLFIPGRYIPELGRTWREIVPEIIRLYPVEERLASNAFYTDQFSFIISLIKTSTPYRALPLELNFPTHQPVHEAFGPRQINPVILHHHHRHTDDHRLAYCSYDNVNKLIDRFNHSVNSL